MTKFIKVSVVISAHCDYTNLFIPVIRVLYFSVGLMCTCFRSSRSAIYDISPCSTSILLQPNLAFPFRRIRDLWYTSTHVERCTVSPV